MNKVYIVSAFDKRVFDLSKTITHHRPTIISEVYSRISREFDYSGI